MSWTTWEQLRSELVEEKDEPAIEQARKKIAVQANRLRVERRRRYAKQRYLIKWLIRAAEQGRIRVADAQAIARLLGDAVEQGIVSAPAAKEIARSLVDEIESGGVPPSQLGDFAAHIAERGRL
ncbi:hypothetical protein ACFY0G_10220 [Streptomyces sp. NPDC001552]|uniref:hypothetical protein n=1 Tax=Streptomyces sp. NPDC001552 TaxID=3364587 RepID=UPI00367F9676